MASMRAFALVSAVSAAAGVTYPTGDSYANPGSCPAGVPTACGSNSTCCAVLFSNSGYGCCNGGPNAVCCGLQGCCQAGYTCQNTPPYTSVCVPASGPTVPAIQVCEPGAQYPTNYSKLPSMIAIGDSVSIGYTPQVATLLKASVFVQHSPWSGGGGTDDVANGVNCQEEFLRTSMYEEQAWDLVSFNFGLHDLNNATAAEDMYAAHLTNFTDRLLRTGSKLVYVTTTPYMPDRFFGNTVVEDLNTKAKAIMAARNIPVADLYTRVTDLCGAIYKNCSICDNEFNNATGVYCGYHYTPAGWEYLAEYLAPIFAGILGA